MLYALAATSRLAVATLLPATEACVAFACGRQSATKREADIVATPGVLLCSRGRYGCNLRSAASLAGPKRLEPVERCLTCDAEAVGTLERCLACEAGTFATL